MASVAVHGTSQRMKNKMLFLHWHVKMSSVKRPIWLHSTTAFVSYPQQTNKALHPWLASKLTAALACRLAFCLLRSDLIKAVKKERQREGKSALADGSSTTQRRTQAKQDRITSHKLNSLLKQSNNSDYPVGGSYAQTRSSLNSGIQVKTPC